jgi:DNA-binding transcriptional MerR regulator
MLIDLFNTYGIKRNFVFQMLYTFFPIDNVNEYLKLAANADKQQLQRIKAVFEKKNQKSAQSISQLQKKLESYNKKLKDLETHGLSSTHRQPREMLRDMGQGLK